MSAARGDADLARARQALGGLPPPHVDVPPPTQPTVTVDVEGVDVAATALVVEGCPTPTELRGSLATLVLGHEDVDVRRARAALADAVAAAGTSVGVVARAEARARALVERMARVGQGVGIGVVAGALLGMVGAPVWLLAREPGVMRAELGSCALLAGACVLVLALAVLLSARLGRDAHGEPRPGTTLELGAIVAVGTLATITVLAVVHRATVLDAWSPAVVAGVGLQVVGIACAAGVLVVAFAPQRLPGAARHLASGVVLATPAVRLRALADRFAERIEGLDARGAQALDATIDAELARLVASGALPVESATASTPVDVHELPFDAHLAARLAVHPSTTVVLRPHLTLTVVATVLDGGSNGARLVRRIVAAVAGRRSRAGTPWEAGMLVDLVAAAHVPVLAQDRPLAVAASFGRTAALALAATALVVALVALAAWQQVAADVTRAAAPSAAVGLVAAAAALLLVADVVERVGRLRSLPVTAAWVLAAATATVVADAVASSTPYSPYLVGLRAPWALAAASVAVLAACAFALRVVERLRGRAHDAVHRGSIPWPLPRARAATLERRRAHAIEAASTAHVDEIVAHLRPAIVLAVDIAALDERVLATLPRIRSGARGSTA